MKKNFYAIFTVALILSYSLSAFGWETVTSPAQIFDAGYIQVVGVSDENQSRYRALRAATLVAQRDLLEILEGLSLHGSTTVKDGMLQSDMIQTSVRGILRGAMKCGERYYDDKRYAEVCMKIYLRGRGSVYDVILPTIQDAKMTPPPMPMYKPKLIIQPQVKPQVPVVVPDTSTIPNTPAVPEITKPTTFEPIEPIVDKPSQILNPHDGLILDVRGFSFKPALINRIISEGKEIIFDPSKIAGPILIERGCGGFTNDESKAKALLSSWGVKNPMTLKASGVSKMTDVQVSEDSAAAIFTHNQKSQFLNEAKVVFLLN